MYMHQFMLIFMGENFRFGKKGTLMYNFHPFYRVTLKKKNVLFYFFFPSINNSLVFQAGNYTGK